MFSGLVLLKPPLTALGPIAPTAISHLLGPLSLPKLARLKSPHKIGTRGFGHALGQPVMSFAISEGFHERSPLLANMGIIFGAGSIFFDTDQALLSSRSP